MTGSKDSTNRASFFGTTHHDGQDGQGNGQQPFQGQGAPAAATGAAGSIIQQVRRKDQQVSTHAIVKFPWPTTDHFSYYDAKCR